MILRQLSNDTAMIMYTQMLYKHLSNITATILRQLPNDTNMILRQLSNDTAMIMCTQMLYKQLPNDTQTAAE